MADDKARAKEQRREKIRAALAQFGYKALRGLQGPALRSVLTKKDTVVLMPTGGGKSLCYQLPALLLPGMVVVVCPLLALMQDQVQALRARHVRVEMLSSLVSDADRKRIFEELQSNGSIDLLYTTPETLGTDAVSALLKKLYAKGAVALFAVDEAHCISSWGHDFRPAYRQLGKLRVSFPKVPFMALTATATQEVRTDIHRQLRLSEEANVLLGDFNRPNITYSVCDKEQLADPIGELVQFINKYHSQKAGVVYVHKRADTDALVEQLKAKNASMKVAAFHAKLPQHQREQTLQQWLRGEIDVICATIAFGMGIDHPSVRFVVHWNMPKTLENLYQEAGRAGRDGQPSHSVVFYAASDYSLFQFLLTKDHDKTSKLNHAKAMLDQVQRYATRKECRRQCILRYFGQRITVAECRGTCDVCNPKLKFFRFAQQIDTASEQTVRRATAFAKQSIRDVDARQREEGSGGKRQRTADARRNNLLHDRAGAYAPSETESLVVQQGSGRSLAAAGFVAVNGDALSDEDGDGGDGSHSLQDELARVVSRGTKRASMETTLEMLERAEQEMQSDEDSGRKRSRSRLAAKLKW